MEQEGVLIYWKYFLNLFEIMFFYRVYQCDILETKKYYIIGSLKFNQASYIMCGKPETVTLSIHLRWDFLMCNEQKCPLVSQQ